VSEYDREASIIEWHRPTAAVDQMNVKLMYKVHLVGYYFIVLAQMIAMYTHLCTQFFARLERSNRLKH
jgi:hypothetical protein